MRFSRSFVLTCSIRHDESAKSSGPRKITTTTKLKDKMIDTEIWEVSADGKTFPGITGFSSPNLHRMRQFYGFYHPDEILSPLVREISWTKNLVIMDRCKDAVEREFYIRRTSQFGWWKSVLMHQIENQTYQKTVLSQTNFDVAPESGHRRASR